MFTSLENRPATRDQILEALRTNRSRLRAMGVRRLGLFGSAARNEATAASDLDFLIELDEKTFDKFMDVKFFLEDLFEREIDLVLRDAVKPRLLDSVLKDLVHAEGF